MAEPTIVVRCPHCHHPYPMSAMQREVYGGRNMGCMQCGRPFRVAPVEARPAPAAAGDGNGAASAEGSAQELDGEQAPPRSPEESDAHQAQAQRRETDGLTLAASGLALGIGSVVVLLAAVVVLYVTLRSGRGPVAGMGVFHVLIVLCAGAGVGAAACGAVARRRLDRGGARGWRMAMFSLVGGVSLWASAAIVAMLLAPTLVRSRERSHLQTCRDNLGAIGAALLSTAVPPQQRLSERLELLAEGGAVNARQLLCPGGDSTPIPVQPNSDMPIKTNYAYVADGDSLVDLPPTAVLVYERPGHHPGGGHVLFADGSVAFFSNQRLTRLESELSQGHNPPDFDAATPP